MCNIFVMNYGNWLIGCNCYIGLDSLVECHARLVPLLGLHVHTAEQVENVDARLDAYLLVEHAHRSLVVLEEEEDERLLCHRLVDDGRLALRDRVVGELAACGSSLGGVSAATLA